MESNLTYEFLSFILNACEGIKEFGLVIYEILALRVKFTLLDVNIDVSVFNVIFGASITLVLGYSIVKWIIPIS